MRRVHRLNFDFHELWNSTSKMTVLQNDADVGWYVNHLAYNAGEISGLLISRMVFVQIFSQLIIQKSLQMLCESRRKNLKFSFSLLT